MLEKLEQLLKQKKSNEFYAEKLGITVQEVKDLKKELKEKEDEESGLEIEGNTQRYNFDKGEVEISSIYKVPPTPEMLIADHKIDTTKYKLSAYYSKGVKGGWRATSLLKSIDKEESKLDSFKEFLEKYKPSYTPIEKEDLRINPTFDRPSCLVLSLADFHIGKLDRDMVPIEERLKAYKETVDSLLHRTYLTHNIDEICFVLGNDLLQIDSIRSETVKGTAVESSMTWDTSYEVAFDLMAETIHKLKQYCNKLTVVYVPGNHSASREYYITHALEIMFRKDRNISFNRSTDKYKCFSYGETAIFLNHGDNINDKLPLLFAQTFPKEWGKRKYKEILLGDKHHNSEKTFAKTQGEAQGVRMRIISSLSATDQWHYDNAFTNSIQAGIALVYDKEKGKVSEFEHRI